MAQLRTNTTGRAAGRHGIPLGRPRCGETTKIIAFVEARQGDMLCKIRGDCGLQHDPPPPGPGRPPTRNQIPCQDVADLRYLI